MAKRFTESEKWKDPWFRRLPCATKLLWMWLCDQCDGAGIIDPDMDLAAFQIGAPLSEADLSAFEGRLEVLENGKWMLTKFISFQYGSLSDACPAHRPIFRSLESNRVLIPYPKGIDTLQDKDKDKDKEKETDKDKDKDAKKTKIQNEVPAGRFSAATALALAEWERHRRELKKPITPTSWEKLLKQAETDGEAVFVTKVEHSIRNGYQGLFAPNQNGSAQAGNSTQLPHTTDTL